MRPPVRVERISSGIICFPGRWSRISSHVTTVITVNRTASLLPLPPSPSLSTMKEAGLRTSFQRPKAQFRIHHDHPQSFESSVRAELLLGADAKRIKPSCGKRFLFGAAEAQQPAWARPEVGVEDVLLGA
jgi:hypothetical protein